MKHRLFCLLASAFLLLAAPVLLRAQNISGTGQQATDLFTLPAGLATFEIEHEGEGAFAVRLLDEQGELIDNLASTTGPFRGSRAVRVPRPGRYLVDVSATGAWSIRLRQRASDEPAASISPAFLHGEEAGSAAARSVPTTSWLTRGFLGGALAGPVGAAVAVALAGKSGIRAPAALAGEASGDTAFRRGFEEGFAMQVRHERKKKAFVGGMIGTGIFITALIYTLDIAGSGSGSGPINPPPPGTEAARLPSPR
ncbi:MAG TPA: hypothetical protein VGR27_03735 [Longimicrobiaceae bacterium]|nr:hypothetical protein [Longimicrobiaceae bacterium]